MVSGVSSLDLAAFRGCLSHANDHGILKGHVCVCVLGGEGGGGVHVALAT